MKHNIVENLTNQIEKIGKRKRFMIVMLVLTITILFSSFLTFSVARYFVILVFLIAYFISFLAVPTGINKSERLMLFILPIYFTIVYNLFFFFLPPRWLTRLPFIIIYSVSIYAILLSSNILNIGAQKTLQLFRAAFSINFLFLTFSLLLASNLLLSFKLNFLINFICFFIIIFPLSLQFLWSVNPKTHIEPLIIRFALFISYIIAQVGLFFSFLPIASGVFSLTISACFYSVSGLFYSFLEERLFKERIREYVFVLIFIVLMLVLSINWA